MKMNKKELAIIKEAEARGMQVDWPALERKFNFGISGIVTHPVDVGIFGETAKKVTALAEADDFSCELDSIIVFPIISEPSIYKRHDFIKHKHSQKSVFVGLNIDFFKWNAAPAREKKFLVKNLFREAITGIRDNALSEVGKLTLLLYIELV